MTIKEIEKEISDVEFCGGPTMPLFWQKYHEIIRQLIKNLNEKQIELDDSELWVNCLEGAGVDNWQGYDSACESYEEYTKK